VADMFPKSDLADAIFKSVETFATTLVRNDGGGRFTLIPLPREAQLAPVYGIQPQDVDGDGGALPSGQSKTGTINRTSTFCGRAGSNRRACRKETSPEKTAATCFATGAGEHFGARSDVAFSGTIDGNHCAFA